MVFLNFIAYLIGCIIALIAGIFIGIKIDFIAIKDNQKNMVRCINCKQCRKIMGSKTENPLVSCKYFSSSKLPDYCGYFERKDPDDKGDIYPKVHDTLNGYLTAIETFSDEVNKN